MEETMKRLTFIVVAGVIVCACGGADGTLGDAGLGGDAANDVSSNDGSTQDVSQDSPSSSDANDAATCPAYCAGLTPTPTFCSDFDNESTPADWTQTVTGMGGTITVEQSDE